MHVDVIVVRWPVGAGVIITTVDVQPLPTQDSVMVPGVQLSVQVDVMVVKRPAGVVTITLVRQSLVQLEGGEIVVVPAVGPVVVIVTIPPEGESDVTVTIILVTQLCVQSVGGVIVSVPGFGPRVVTVTIPPVGIDEL